MRRTNNMGNGTCIVVIEGIGSKIEFRTLHLHIEIEHRHLALGVVLSPIGSQRGLTVHHLSALKEVSIIVQAVKIEGVGIECGLAVFEHHIISSPRHLFITVVISIIRN